MATSLRSDAGRMAGVWALSELRSQLGDDWLDRVAASEGSIPSEILMADMHAVAFAEMLDFALRLRLLRDVEGTIDVRRALRSDLRQEYRVHAHAVLGVAALAQRRGYGVALEKRRAPGGRPTDVVVTSPSAELACEVFVVLADHLMREGMAATSAVTDAVRRICWGHRVEFGGHVDASLSAEGLEALFAEVEQVARAVELDGSARVVERQATRIEVVSMDEAAQREMSFTGPVVSGKGHDRLDEILRTKAEQAVAAGAGWIRADVLDGLWQFTPWATWDLPAKGEALAGEIRSALSDVDGIAGAVLSCGPAMAQGLFVAESARLAGGGFAIRRTFEPIRVRETVVVPMLPGHENEAAEWVALYDAEPGWLDWALLQVGLRPAAHVLDRTPPDDTRW